MRGREAARPTPRGWSRPGKRTTDQGRFLTSPTWVGVHSCGHSAGFSPASLWTAPDPT